MSEQHLINRNVGIALAIICGILVFCLAQTLLWGLDQDSALKLGKSDVWTDNETISENAGTSYTKAFFMDAPYAGYVQVQVLTSTSDKTYVHVWYGAYVASYDNTIEIGRNGTAVFPILPARFIDIDIGNSEPVGAAIQNQTITITYYY